MNFGICFYNYLNMFYLYGGIVLIGSSYYKVYYSYFCIIYYYKLMKNDK